jgi:tellurite resistance protein TerA
VNTFSRGQKGKLTDLGLSTAFAVTLDFQTPGFTVDVSCFGLDANGQLSDDRFMVFFNQKTAPDNAIQYQNSGNQTSFALDLARLPATIDKLVFTASIDGNSTMKNLGSSGLRLGDAVSFDFSGADFQDEKALIIGEIYRRDGTWRFGAVGQGFNGGLSALLKHFGGTEQAAPPASSASAAALGAAAAALAGGSANSAPATPKPVSLSKVTLAKTGDKVSLEKKAGASFGKIRVNLNWSQGQQIIPASPEKPGLLGQLFGKPAASPSAAASSGNIDLDLGCLYELASGKRGAIQALGNLWGALEQAPFIHLEGDDRTGSVSAGENLFINGSQFDQIKRVLVYTYIYEGAPNWAATNGVVTLEAPGQPPVEVKLDNGGSEKMCAIAMLENKGGNLQVTKLVEYFSGKNGISGHQLMDERYGFGLKWVAGAKD